MMLYLCISVNRTKWTWLHLSLTWCTNETFPYFQTKFKAVQFSVEDAVAQGTSPPISSPLYTPGESVSTSIYSRFLLWWCYWDWRKVCKASEYLWRFVIWFWHRYSVLLHIVVSCQQYQCMWFPFRLRIILRQGHDSQQNSSHSPRLSQAQYSLTVQNRGLKQQLFHFISIILANLLLTILLFWLT